MQVQVINVSKRYGEHNVEALRSVCLRVQKGTFVAIMGPSGCGKSTLLNCLSGLDLPTSGEIIIDGQHIERFNEQQLTALRRDKIGFVFQFFNLLSTLTVRENISLPLELAGKWPRQTIAERADQLLALVGLSPRADFYPAQLSGGEMQRAAIARAVIANPQIIVADEPTGNLDTANGQNILELLRSMCKERGETIIMATHSEEAAAFADQIVHMKDGRIVEPAAV